MYVISRHYLKNIGNFKAINNLMKILKCQMRKSKLNLVENEKHLTFFVFYLNCKHEIRIKDFLTNANNFINILLD